MKKILVFVVIVAIAGLVLASIVILSRNAGVGKRDSTGLVVGKNAIYIAEHAPSKTITVVFVRLETPGFVAIHEDADGSPGKILGASNLIPAGETKGLKSIELSRKTKDNETIYGVLHLDDGDAAFDASKDKPAKDSNSGEDIIMIVTVSADANEPGDVNP